MSGDAQMNQLEALHTAIASQYDRRPNLTGGLLFVGSADYMQFDAWAARLQALRLELIDLCEGRIEIVCYHPAGAVIANRFTGECLCDLCGKELR
jgi:hypothetical protein